MPTIPYIHFQGQCADALAFYADVFGSNDLQTIRYGDAPDASEAMKASGRVIHGQLTIWDGTLMASDFPPGFEGDPQKAVSVMQSAPDSATGQRVFDRLCEGGAVIQPYGPSFFSPGFGMVKDRFGTHWMISVMPQEGSAP
jgi:PhnB protein